MSVITPVDAFHESKYLVEQSLACDLRAEALNYAASLGCECIIYFYDDDFEVIELEGKTGFDYNPATDIWIKP